MGDHKFRTTRSRVLDDDVTEIRCGGRHGYWRARGRKPSPSLNVAQMSESISEMERLSISRYIVVAVVRCSCASYRLPVRR